MTIPSLQGPKSSGVFFLLEKSNFIKKNVEKLLQSAAYRIQNMPLCVLYCWPSQKQGRQKDVHFGPTPPLPLSEFVQFGLTPPPPLSVDVFYGCPLTQLQNWPNSSPKLA